MSLVPASLTLTLLPEKPVLVRVMASGAFLSYPTWLLARGKGVEVKQGALVQRGIKRALAYGALATLDGRPRPGKEPTTTAD